MCAHFEHTAECSISGALVVHRHEAVSYNTIQLQGVCEILMTFFLHIVNVEFIWNLLNFTKVLLKHYGGVYIFFINGIYVILEL